MAASAYCEPEVGVGDVVPFVSSHCPVPSSGTAGVDLMGALDEPLQDVVRNFETTVLQDDDVWGAVSRDTSHLRPYSDPCLKSRPKYIQFLQKIVDGCLVNRQRLVSWRSQTAVAFLSAVLISRTVSTQYIFQLI